MKKVILIIEDNKEQQELAKKATFEAGYGIILAENLIEAWEKIHLFGNKLHAIITDLHFPEMEGDPKPEKPSGLAVVVSAIQAKIPIAICADVNNHYAKYAKMIVDFLGMHTVCGQIPFSMNNKDWAKTIQELEILISKGDSQ